MPYTYAYPRPAVTVDVAVFAPRGERWHVLLIQRAKDPFKGKWALPGGFVDEGEDLTDAARRELVEETGVDDVRLVQCATYGKPDRDPRGRVITVTYAAVLDTIREEARAGDDAARASWFPMDNLPDLAFDHRRIIGDCFKRAVEGAETAQ